MKRKPAKVGSALGPLSVTYVEEIRGAEGKVIEDTLGLFNGAQRAIQVLSGQHPDQEAHTLLHEWVHGVLWDTGLSNLLTNDQIEAVCDAMSTALMRWEPPMP